MIHYNRNNNAYCRAVNAETYQTIERNPVRISILFIHKKPIILFTFKIVICIDSVRRDIGQMSTNTSSYIICSAPNVYILVYILIETPYSTFKADLCHPPLAYLIGYHVHFRVIISVDSSSCTLAVFVLINILLPFSVPI